MDEKQKMRSFIAANIQHAIETEHIRIYFQPIVRALTGKLCGMEALARWEDPLYGLIPPDVFVPVLEETRLIHLLDAFVIRKVGEHLYFTKQQRRDIVPVSFNLSRLDFTLMDPFAVVQSVAEYYALPHELLRAEITESVLAEDDEAVVAGIARFREHGYQIWLDDFGSGYSSLAVLHRYAIDEMKLDRTFLAQFDDGAKQLIRTIVLMAKSLGIHTLVEGAETEEHVAFLRDIGVEQIQGYYYGAPKPLVEVQEHIRTRRLWPETRVESQIYAAVGLLNVMTDSATALVRFTDTQISMLWMNRAFAALASTLSVVFVEPETEHILTHTSPARRKMTAFLQKAASSDTPEHMTFVDGGRYIRMEARCVAGTAGQYILQTKMETVSLEADYMEEEGRRFDRVLRHTMSLFDEIWLLNVRENVVEIILTANPLYSAGTKLDNIMMYFMKFANEDVHEADQERFRQFVQYFHTTLSRQESQPCFDGLFRLLQPDGSYRWKVFHVLIYEKDGYQNKMLLIRDFVAETQPDPVNLMRKVFHSYGGQIMTRDTAEVPLSAMRLWRTLLRFSDLKVFWKDTDRRFVGVSRSFLDFYGFSTQDQVIGRTDEELHWHIDDEDFRSKEYAVLQQGKVVRDAVGQCVVRGVQHTITASKFPVYRGERIVGLMGVFRDVEHGLQASRYMIDNDTETANFRGALMAGMQFDENYRRAGEPYLCVLFSVPEYESIGEAYGMEIRLKTLRRVRDEILKFNRYAGTVAHIGGARFLCISKQMNDADMVQRLYETQKRIESITSVDGYRMTLHCAYAHARCEETTDFDGLLRLLLARLNDTMHFLGEKDMVFSDRISIDTVQFDSLDVIVFAIDAETHTLVYLNRQALEVFGMTEPSQAIGRKCHEVFSGLDTPCDFCPGSELSTSGFSVRRIHNPYLGHDLMVRSTLVQWNGRSYVVTFAFDLTAAQKAEMGADLGEHETVINDALTIGLQEENADIGIMKLISKLGQYLEAERFCIFEENTDGTVSCTYEWYQDDLQPAKNTLQRIPIFDMEVLYDVFRRQQVFVEPDMKKFCETHPEVKWPLRGSDRLIAGHLQMTMKSIGFTLVINPRPVGERASQRLLTMLTRFVAIMLRDRNQTRNLVQLSTKDLMTGVCNRHAFMNRVQHTTKGRSYAFIYGDINGLKHVNDTQGHEAGDKLICSAADVMRETLGAENVFRMGGDEFLMIAEGRDKSGAAHVVRKLSEGFAARGVSVALGCAVETAPFLDIDALCRKADQRMYGEKGKFYRRRATDWTDVRTAAANPAEKRRASDAAADADDDESYNQ